MEVSKKIHIFNSTERVYNQDGWEINCHSRDNIRNYIESEDKKEGTNHLEAFDKITTEEASDEFYKYIVLHNKGGIFARYGTDENIPLEQLTELVNYCNNRQISLFQCPSVIIVGFVHHPQLLSMLSDPIFHPLSNLFRRMENTSQGHKTLVTSLPLNSYLDKIKSTPTPIKDTLNSILIGSSLATSVAIGIITGMLFSRSLKP